MIIPINNQSAESFFKSVKSSYNQYDQKKIMKLTNLLSYIISDNELHARWLNTLSLMENTGARKISASEDQLTVTYIILKHAAEEHRHAFYLKKQLEKTGENLCPTYAPEYLLAPSFSRYYLNQLDIRVCRYLKNEMRLAGKDLRFAAYLLVTYAIEVRADELYPVYQDALENAGSKVNVKSIILEEEGHLEEMISQLKKFSPDWEFHAQKAVEFESGLFLDWVDALAIELVD
jgi:rubrerythrin